MLRTQWHTPVATLQVGLPIGQSVLLAQSGVLEEANGPDPQLAVLACTETVYVPAQTEVTVEPEVAV